MHDTPPGSRFRHDRVLVPDQKALVAGEPRPRAMPSQLASDLGRGRLVRFEGRLPLELGAVQLGVHAARGEEFGVGTPFHDPPLDDHEDLIGFADSREAMGDDDGGAAGQRRPER